MSQVNRQWDPVLSAEPIVDISGIVRSVFGMGLLVGGVIITLLLLVQIKQLVAGPDDPYILRKLDPSAIPQMVLTYNSGQEAAADERLELPPQALLMIGYIVSVLLLWIAAKLAVALLRGGTSLLLSTRRPRPGETAENPQHARVG